MAFNESNRKRPFIKRNHIPVDPIIDGKKLCPKCQNTKATTCFNKQSKRKNGYQIWCNDCGKLAKKKQYLLRGAELRLTARKSWLKRKYGLTLKSYELMEESQQGKCAICERVPIDGGNQFKKNFLCIDHDHTTGKVRGLLCSECNFGISKFDDNVKFLNNAIKYLKKYTDDNV